MFAHPGPVRNRGQVTTKVNLTSEPNRKHIFMGKSSISLLQLFKLFPNEHAARSYFEAQRWPDNPICPACGEAKRIWHNQNRPGYFRCNADKLVFTVCTGTIFERQKIGLYRWVYAMYLLVTARKGISSVQLAKEIGVTQKTAWFILARLREACGNDLARQPVSSSHRLAADLCGIDEMTKKNLASLDAITAKVFAYQPADKAKWAKSAKPQKLKQNDYDSHSSL